ncbi:thymidine phosphorylase-like [Tubulanus polymorphus]|uniref:thymidine phosphorylase-like n=1 Tax=Tubulanus polymorphus TaxID=672921 RepID=UPI003DA53541
MDCHLLNTPALIAKKRDGHTLTKSEIQYFIDGVVNGDNVELAQLGAMLMAIKLRGMSMDETVLLTAAMKESGETLHWPDQWKHILVDKHSTGGVGDKVSLILAPALAACGLKVPMISGRGLSFTGGTLDKLEAIPGFNVSMSPDEIIRTLDTVGCCIVGQTQDIDPADRIMYAVRDLTATVDSIPLITASIISKKAAENIAALVLDVKFGEASFMKTKEDAMNLATWLVDVGTGCGIKTEAVISSMDIPLGHTVGNGLEVKEAIECLSGNGAEQLVELVSVEGGLLLHSVGKVNSLEEGENLIKRTLNNGSALEKFQAMIVAQGVNQKLAERICEREGDVFRVLRKANFKTPIKAHKSGFVDDMNALLIAELCSDLGAGRKRSGDPINHAIGVELLKLVGDSVQQDEVLAYVHHDEEFVNGFLERIASGIMINDQLNADYNIKRIHHIIT